MFLQSFQIHPGMSPSEIVLQDHRTADVFRKYQIEYCCTGRLPLEKVCAIQNLIFTELKAELETAMQPLQLPPGVPFDTWDIDFLSRYITHVHHTYVKTALPQTAMLLKEFAEEHKKKYPYMMQVYDQCEMLGKVFLPHLHHEEETVFPYIRQIAQALRSNESYGKLLVKTFRKPLDNVGDKKENISSVIEQMRALTSNYTPPVKACVNHLVVLQKLKELDIDTAQHMYLEHQILFPKAIDIEKRLLQ